MNPTRITVAFDSSTANLLEKISKEAGLSQSEIMRRALRFYYENRVLENDATRKKIYTYMDLLLNGEHVILDVDHWLLFLKLVESCPSGEQFWEEHRDVARSHTEQLKTKVRTAEELLTRLETCNFFRVTKNSNEDFTLVLGSELPKTFVRIFLEEYFAGMGVKAEIKENLAKLRVTVKR
ncbi:CopG family transcriptional regulator [Candidatus Bathyarchaeota archaeon]|nr:CopG family transcriptional regulator [Candidatus Bathyarchaeota archaeon]